MTADQLMELAAKAAEDSFRRYPHNRTERLADEAATLRTLIELAANALREHEQAANR